MPASLSAMDAEVRAAGSQTTDRSQFHAPATSVIFIRNTLPDGSATHRGGSPFRAGLSTREAGEPAMGFAQRCEDSKRTDLHQLGFNHNQLTYLHNGRPETLTDSVVTNARVVDRIINNSVRNV
jgi:hypothetical protein